MMPPVIPLRPKNKLSLKQKTLSGILWSVIAQVARQAMQFIISVILARLLIPADFGLVGMVMVFTGFAGLFGDLGFGSALVQKAAIDDRHLSSVFWVNILTGLVLAVLIFMAAPLIAGFYNEPVLKPITMLISVSFVISSIGIVPASILRRSMDFRKLAFIDMVQIAFAGSIAIALALAGFGLWSLVWQLLISGMVSALLLGTICSWRPQLTFSGRAVKELLHFSSNLTGYNLFNYWARSLDNLLIGKFIGSAGLGIYTRAYSTMLMPISQVSTTVGQVMFPSLSTIQAEKIRVKKIYLNTLAMIALISFPMMMGLMVVADDFVFALFGQKWVEVIPILRILCLIGMLQSLVTTVGWIYTSQGRTDWLFRWGIVAGSAGIISFIAGVWVGSIRAVAICYAVANILLLYHNFTIPGKLIGMTFAEVATRVSGILGCALTMGGLVFLLQGFLPAGLSPWMRLLTQVPFGIFIYTCLIHGFNLKAYADLKALLQEQWQARVNREKTAC